jgi:hypothetical protein
MEIFEVSVTCCGIGVGQNHETHLTHSVLELTGRDLRPLNVPCSNILVCDQTTSADEITTDMVLNAPVVLVIGPVEGNYCC